MTAEVVTTRPSSGALALRSDQDRWTETQQAALAQIGVDEASDGDQAVLMHVSQRTGLDPFSRQIYLIGRWDPQSGGKKWTIQTGIDGFRIIAERHPQYAGQLEPEWCGADGVWREVWSDRRQPPLAARVGVLRHDWPKPVYAVCHFAEFAQYKRDGNLTAMWQQKAAHQIAKCAEAGALRKAFPQDLSGLYTDDEMAHTENPERATYNHQDTGPSRRVTAADIVEPDWEARLTEYEAAGDRDKLAELWRQARARRPDDTELRGRITAAGERLKAAQAPPAADGGEGGDDVVDAEVVDDSPPDDESAQPAGNPQMFALLGEAGLSGNTAAVRARRLKLMTDVLGRQIGSSKELTPADREQLIATLQRWKRNEELDRAEEVASEEAAMEQMQAEDVQGEGSES